MAAHEGFRDASSFTSSPFENDDPSSNDTGKHAAIQVVQVLEVGYVDAATANIIGRSCAVNVKAEPAASC